MSWIWAEYFYPTRYTLVLHPMILASPLKYRVALLSLVFTRLHLGSLALRPAGLRCLLLETLSHRSGSERYRSYPIPRYGADKQLPRSAPFSRLEQRALRWALTGVTPSFSSSRTPGLSSYRNTRRSPHHAHRHSAHSTSRASCRRFACY